MGVTLKDVKELSNPNAPLKAQLFIQSTSIDRWTKVSEIDGKGRKKEKYGVRRKEQEKRDRQKREKRRCDTVKLPVHLPQVRCPIRLSMV